MRFLVTTDVYLHYRRRPNSMVSVTRDPTQNALFMHDMMRNGLNMKALQPLGFLAFLTTARQMDILREIGPLPVDRHDFKILFVRTAKRELRLYRIKFYLFYPLARQRRQHRKKILQWKNLLSVAIAMDTN